MKNVTRIALVFITAIAAENYLIIPLAVCPSFIAAVAVYVSLRSYRVLCAG